MLVEILAAVSFPNPSFGSPERENTRPSSLLTTASPDWMDAVNAAAPPAKAKRPGWELWGDDEYAPLLEQMGWHPSFNIKPKAGHYLDNRELFFLVIQIKRAGGTANAGAYGERFVVLMYLLARSYLGKIAFKSQAQMSNLAEDIIQEACTKAVVVAHKFKPFGENGKVNTNAFAYFTTVQKHRAYEAFGTCLNGSDCYLEDLKADGQSLGDVI